MGLEIHVGPTRLVREQEVHMRPSSPHFFPLAPPFLVGLAVLVGVLLTLLEFGVIRYAYEKAGIGHRQAVSLLLLSLLGSYINVPVAELPPERVSAGREVAFFGLRYVVPAVEQWQRTIVAVNVGGAVIPTVVSVYLLWWTGLWLPAAGAVAVVTAVVHALARPIPGVGIGVPFLVPPMAAASAALVLAPQGAAAVAYVAGTLGTLIGADLLNLDKIRGLGAPVASIGGAGRFDGIFMTGVLAVLLA
jgi:uncharacterized membrane protein